MFLKNKIIDFMGLRKIALIISLVLILVSIGSLFARGLNLGVDFTGGTVMEIGYPESKNPDIIRQLLADNGYDGIVQHFGSSKEILIRLAPQEGEGNDTAEAKAELSNNVLAVLRTETPNADMRRVEFVGPQIGEELREQGGLAMLMALGGILIYVALRFEYRFSIGAVVALVHDVIIVIGFFALTQIEFDLTVLAAILAVIGYSLNDTIVVFDRQRENFRILRKETPAEVLNISLNQTLSRTLITSLTTLIVVLALYFLGSEVIAAFAIALTVGIVIGTYSSIYVASNLLLILGITKEALIPPEKDDEELDAIP
ncbi:MAG: Protein-export membrane protein SecF (TC 3.A.5.1.1) [uncultured Thiotrichaceae bacterium]|uniref:Protein-export membrane protein SecF n=1 Tax=uncultured Thiotrichaceae bacterium TaxID=298394 RepID=A0A6S6SEX8_9GAMM|nr:MAG: Protein-export membrane protein SecF (TC 3.A.5.1.1) [uncultured Thiotrichaceae bacterium]